MRTAALALPRTTSSSFHGSRDIPFVSSFRRGRDDFLSWSSNALLHTSRMHINALDLVDALQWEYALVQSGAARGSSPPCRVRRTKCHHGTPELRPRPSCPSDLSSELSNGSKTDESNVSLRRACANVLDEFPFVQMR